MKRMLRIASGILIAIGVIWILQGVGVLPGSFMTGQTRWAVIGCITAVVGIIFWVASNRRA
jgi:hypothetical protein